MDKRLYARGKGEQKKKENKVETMLKSLTQHSHFENEFKT